MAMKPAKTFDCVAMKIGVQAQLQAEYETRRSEFSSYADFITRTADEDPWIRAFKLRIQAAREDATHYGSSEGQNGEPPRDDYA